MADRAPRYGRACKRVFESSLGKKSRCVSSAIAFAVTDPTSFVLPIALPRCRPPASGSLPASWRAGFRRRKDRSPPAWGRPGTMHSGGVLLAPLPEQRKGGLDEPTYPACVQRIAPPVSVALGGRRLAPAGITQSEWHPHSGNSGGSNVTVRSSRIHEHRGTMRPWQKRIDFASFPI